MLAVAVAVLLAVVAQHHSGSPPAGSSAAGTPAAPVPAAAAVTDGPRTTLATVDGVDPDGNRASFVISQGRPVALSKLNNPTLRQSLADQFPGATNGINRAVVVPIHAEGGVLASHSDIGSEDVELTVTQDRGTEGLTPLVCSTQGTCQGNHTPALASGLMSPGFHAANDVYLVFLSATSAAHPDGDPQQLSTYFVVPSLTIDPYTASGPTSDTVTGPFACPTTLGSGNSSIIGLGAHPTRCT